MVAECLTMATVSCMSCDGNNATPPSPAIAPGIGSVPSAAEIDPRHVAEALVRAFGPGGMDPRVPGVVPGFDAPFFQAGLAGYSDAAMRIIARRHGCPYCVTEALLDQTLLAGGRGFAKADLGEIEDNIPGGSEDRPLAGQIMGSDPGEMAAAAVKMVEQGSRREREYRALAEQARLRGGLQASVFASGGVGSSSPAGGAVGPAGERGASFAAIDINLACPVKKIARRARGGHWLADPVGAIRILEAVREALPREIPVTVKMRRSFDDSEEMRENFFRIFDAAYDMGCAWVTVHARTVEQKYIGPSRWDLLREIVQRKHPGRQRDRIIFGSGDVWEAADVFRMIAYCSAPDRRTGRAVSCSPTGSTPTRADAGGAEPRPAIFDPDFPHLCGVSIARGCIGNPWIFRQCRDLLAGRAASLPDIAEQRQVLMQHFELAMSVNRLSTRGLGEAREERAERHTARTMRKFGLRFAEHHPQKELVRRRFIACQNMRDWWAVLEEFYKTEDKK
ncbi:MAG: tRNA-dihydrouridine synthase [Phycisphaerales bacterium]